MTIRRAAPALFVVLLALVLPVSASATTFFVNSTGDQEDENVGANGCKTSVNTCTLRAAIEESNASTGTKDEISFDPMVFEGQLADTIAVGFPLPAIEDAVTIDGEPIGQCTTAAGDKGPCVGVKGESRIAVRADGVTIEGLAISDSQVGIEVDAEDFEAQGNWIGFQLDGTDGPEEQAYGIFVAPHADHAVIGGAAAADRNVFGNANTGLVLRGASFGSVLGNYFGVRPNGTTSAPNGRDLVVANKEELLSEVPASENQIGADVGPEGTATTACDFGCNVFASKLGATAAIDLVGSEFEEEAPADGPTWIEGNYVGLDANGAETENDATFAVNVGHAGGVSVGGEENGSANYISGGGFGIYHEDGKHFTAVGNVIGGSPTGAEVAAPSVGIFFFCLALGTESAEPVILDKNVLEMDGGVGIEAKFGNAEIENNFIEGASVGVQTIGDPPGAGNLIKNNVIGESQTNGILIESDFNNVLHNSVYGSGGAGVRVQNPAETVLVITTGNLIGGSSAAEENTIRENGDDAIQIVDFSGNTEEESYNQVGRNKGAGNGGRFIRLDGNANAGIEAPLFTAQATSASGSGAEPNATIRVFRKQTSDLGEIESFLAEVEADGSGDWTATYPALPGETIVAATQTGVLGGTSELETSTTPGSGGGGGEGGGGSGGAAGGGGQAPVPVDTTPPTTKITKGPKAKSKSTTAKFKFKANEAGSKFQCKLDKGKFKSCRSPKTYKKLKPGKHVFKVRAIDKAGNVGKPAKKKFTVLKR